MQLKVVKNDGRTEDYIQTKILRTLSMSLSQFENENISTAALLTDAFTFYLFSLDYNVITTGEIHSMLKAVLMETGYERAATELHKHHYHRLIKRNHLEVINLSIQSFSDAQMFHQIKNIGHTHLWDKSIIVEGLIQNYQFKYIDARAIASAVEEKVLNSSQNCVTTDFIKQLVLIEAAGFLNSMDLLSEPAKPKHSKKKLVQSQVSYIPKSKPAPQKELVMA